MEGTRNSSHCDNLEGRDGVGDGREVQEGEDICIVCSVTQLCLTLCDLTKLGFPVLHYLLEFDGTHVHWVSDAIQPSHPLSTPSPLSLSLSQHQGLFQQVNSYVYLWLIHIDVWQKSTQHCKAIILQLKINSKLKTKWKKKRNCSQSSEMMTPTLWLASLFIVNSRSFLFSSESRASQGRFLKSRDIFIFNFIS